MHINFFHTVYQTLLNNKEKVLIRWPSEKGPSKSFTGDELLQKIGAIRMALANCSVSPCQPVLLALPVSIDLICTVLAVQAAGAVPVLPPVKASAGGLLRLMKQQQIRYVIIARAPTLLMKAAAIVKNFHYIRLDDKSTGTRQAISIMNVPPEQPALVSHSSGSTGRAKAIYRSHRVLSAQHEVLKEAFSPWPDQIDFPLFPNILLHNLATGIASVLPAIHRFALCELDPATIAAQLISESIQTLTGNVFYFRRLADYLRKNPHSFPQIRALGIGGSPVPESLAQRLQKLFTHAAVYIIYGSSEAEPIAVRKLQQDEKIDPLAGYKVGKVNKHLQLNLSYMGEVAVAGKLYPVGEIKIKGLHVAISEDREALQTGDFGYLDAANELYLTARRGNETVCNGLQHYQLEHLVAHDERVERVAAIATGQGFNLYVQGSISEQDVLNLLKKHTNMKTIRRIYKRKHIPVDARHLSKIIYSKLG